MSTTLLENPIVDLEEEVELLPDEPGHLYTVEEFMALPDDGNRYELVEGELVEMGQPGDKHGRISKRLDKVLTNYVDEKNLGLVYGPTGFRLAPRTVRAPDLAFVQTERVPPETDGAVEVPPDLAVEVISPNDKWSEIVAKVREYQTAGVGLIWLIDPYTPSVMIYHQNDVLHTIVGIEAELSGEEVVPGFKIAVNKLFE
jgi:Uma2 family endonuclease